MERLVVPWFIPRGRSHPWESPGGSSVPRALFSSLLLLISKASSVVRANGSTTLQVAARATPVRPGINQSHSLTQILLYQNPVLISADK